MPSSLFYNNIRGVIKKEKREILIFAGLERLIVEHFFNMDLVYMPLKYDNVSGCFHGDSH